MSMTEPADRGGRGARAKRASLRETNSRTKFVGGVAPYESRGAPYESRGRVITVICACVAHEPKGACTRDRLLPRLYPTENDSDSLTNFVRWVAPDLGGDRQRSGWHTPEGGNSGVKQVRNGVSIELEGKPLHEVKNLLSSHALARESAVKHATN